MQHTPAEFERLEAKVTELAVAVVELQQAVVSLQHIDESIKKGFLAGIEELSKNEEFSKKFWRAGYDQMVNHASSDGTKWVGKTALGWLSGILLAIGAYLAAKSGFK